MRRFVIAEMKMSCSMLLLIFSVVTCTGPYVDVYLVVSSDTPREAKKAKEPVLGLFKAKFRECPYCETMEVELPSGEAITVRAEPEPRVRLSPKDIEEIHLAEVRSVLDPDVRTWIALAMPSEKAQARFQQLSEEFSFDSVLIEINGRPTDVHSIATWSGGIRLAVFEDKDQLQNFAEGLDAPVAWVPFDEEEFEQDSKQLRQFLERE